MPKTQSTGCGVADQLMSEYELGFIDWIWQCREFKVEMFRILDIEMHFGCFVLTGERANLEFVEKFYSLTKSEDCDTCYSIPYGWLSPLSYIAENALTPSSILGEIFLSELEKYKNGSDDMKFEAIMALRSLAANRNLETTCLKVLTGLSDVSLRHGNLWEYRGKD